MGVMNALSTAVTGLSAQSYALENISGNIANSQTIGFKRIDTSFVDLIPDSPNRRTAAGSVVAFSQLTNTLQGNIRATGVETNLALSGDGYFVVKENSGSSTAPTFAGQELFTRRGDFARDAQGFLVNGSGKYLVGASTGAGNGPIKISSAPMKGKQTTEVSYTGNLPRYPKTENADTKVAGSELLDPTLAAAAVSADDEADFLKQTISGGEVTVYDVAGTPVSMQLRWAKTATSAGGAGTDTWSLYYLTDGAATGTAAKWAEAASGFTFDPSGTLTSADTITIAALKIDGSDLGSVAVNFGTNLTQYSDPNGTANGLDVSQDGYGAGTLTSLAISSDGSIIGNYSNGQNDELGKVLVAHFGGDDALRRMDGGTYAQTVESGPPNYGLMGTLLSSGSVEMSNTDISEEFSKMIVTQQAYSANTRVMSTAQQMLQDIINVIR